MVLRRDGNDEIVLWWNDDTHTHTRAHAQKGRERRHIHEEILRSWKVVENIVNSTETTKRRWCVWALKEKWRGSVRANEVVRIRLLLGLGYEIHVFLNTKKKEEEESDISIASIVRRVPRECWHPANQTGVNIRQTYYCHDKSVEKPLISIRARLVRPTWRIARGNEPRTHKTL